MTDTIRQCWAFHKDGTRCDMPAGHPGNHAVERTWTDDECLDPTTVTKPVVITTSSGPTTTVTAPVDINCVACSHKHRGGECKCGCKEFIG